MGKKKNKYEPFSLTPRQYASIRSPDGKSNKMVEVMKDRKTDVFLLQCPTCLTCVGYPKEKPQLYLSHRLVLNRCYFPTLNTQCGIRTPASSAPELMAAMPPVCQQDPAFTDGGLTGHVATRDCSDDPPLVTTEILEQTESEGHVTLPRHPNEPPSEDLATRFWVNGDVPGKEEFNAAIKRIAMRYPGPTEARLPATIGLPDSLSVEWSSPHDFSKLSTALDLLALKMGLERSVEVRQLQLRLMSDVPIMAAISACIAHRPDKAIEWLEQGRSYAWRQRMHLRTPLNVVHVHDPDLAERVARVSSLLQNNTGASRVHTEAGMTQSERVLLEAEASTQLQLTRQWEDLLTEVRAIPGLEKFSKPTLYPAIQAGLPELGPIVVVSAYEARCDAIALLPGLDEGPLWIPLPGLSLERIVQCQKDISSHLASNGLRVGSQEEGDTQDSNHHQGFNRSIARHRRTLQRGDETLRKVLKFLWVEVVKPVLTALAFPNLKDSPAETLPRLWWCPTGPLSFLPIHAAGIYSETQSECLLDYVVSSYTPTVTAITDRVKTEGICDVGKCGLFLTSQPNPLGAARIPGTTKEVAAIHTQALGHGVRVLKFDGDDLSVEDCLERMDDLSCIHLACHASQNASEPLNSCFLFNKGRLTLDTIIQKDLKHADLAFLSACQTCTGEPILEEEAIHLAAGMLAAGYRRVVATMWSINDSHAPDVAKDFYEYLLTHRDEASGSHFNGSLSAHALHHAIQNLRQRLAGDPEQALLAWVPYVHFGY